MKLPWDQIEELTKYLKKKGLSEITIETKQGKITLKKDMLSNGEAQSPVLDIQAPKKEEKQEVKSNLTEVKAPMVGTFYASPSPGAEAFIKVGSRVKKGDILCIIEAMKIMNELTSEVTGTIKEILANDSDVIEYGQVLFRLEP